MKIKLTDAEIKARLKKIKAPKRKMTPFLEAYRQKFTAKNCYGK